MSVISVKINEDEEIEYVNLADSSAELESRLVPNDTRQQRNDDGDDDDNADVAAVEHDADDGDEDDVDDDDEQEQHDDDDADVIDHDPGADLDAAMANQTDDDDDELNTVLVPNSDGSMTIQRKAKAIIEHMCGKCNKSYKSMASLKRHLNLCRHVPKNAAVAQRMKKEMKRSVTSTSLDDIRPNECFCCFEDKASAHVGFIACNFCPKTFKSHINLERHLFTLHAPSAEFACTVCNAQCVSETIYNLHVESHGEGKPFACGKCGKEFTRKYHLDRHLEYTECDPNRPKQKLPCNVCSKEFTRLDNLREHLRSHMGQAQRRKDYQCPYCEKSFYGSSLLNIHIRTHTGERPFPCDLCTCWFPSNGALRKHRRTHTGEKPYECSVCAKCFSVKETLNRHMKIHTGDRKHACPHCEKTFIQAQQLKAHLFYHTGENGFECEQCPQRFNKRSRLELHIRTVHLNANQLTCDVCQEKFRFKGRLAKHLREHIKEAKTSSPTPPTVGKRQSKAAAAAATAALNVKQEEPAEGDEQQRMETVLEIEEIIVPDVIAPDVDVAPVMISRAAKRTADRRGDEGATPPPRPKRLAAAAAAVKVKREEEDQDHDHESSPKKTTKATSTARNSTAARQSPDASAKTPPSANKSPSAFPYPCDHCDRVFSRKGPLAMHLKSHKRAEADSASAAGRLSSASPSAASPETTRPAVRKSPPSTSTAKVAAKKTVTCKVCKKQLNNLDALVKHMKLNHRKLYMLMFADDDGGDDDDDDAEDDDTDDAGDANEDDGGVEQQQEQNIDDDTPTEPTTSATNQENAAAEDDDGDDAEEYEIEVIHMKEEDDDEEPQIVVSRKRSAGGSVAAANLTVDALPAGGLTADQLTDKIGKLLELLVDEQTLAELGWPAAQCELVLERVIEQCGQTPADSDTCPDYATVLRENAKLLFTSVLSNYSIKELLNNHTVDEVIVHVLKLAS